MSELPLAHLTGSQRVWMRDYSVHPPRQPDWSRWMDPNRLAWGRPSRAWDRWPALCGLRPSRPGAPGAPVASATRRFALGASAPTAFAMAQMGYLAYLPIIERAFAGSWSADHRYALGLAWGLLATNLDLVRWALCVATGNGASGDCIEAYIRGEHAVRLVPRGSPCATPRGGQTFNALTWVVDRDAILAAIFAGDPLNLSNPVSLAIVAADLVFGDPEIWWCTVPGLPLDMSGAIVAGTSDIDKDCAIVTLAGSLLHEMTHPLRPRIRGRTGVDL